jgi:pyridoxamine 5'-phosphate oxidase
MSTGLFSPSPPQEYKLARSCFDEFATSTVRDDERAKVTLDTPMGDMRTELANMRRSYGEVGLLESDLPSDPFLLFEKWFSAARENPYIVEANAMVLSTSDLTSRSVLLKDFTSAGFTFFTNYNSRKARAIAANPRVALLFPWYPMERQITITGVAEKISSIDSDAYFATRPYLSQIGAWASSQSEILDSRESLAAKVEEYQAKFPEGGPVPRPEHWGGFLVSAESIEFWQGRYSRLHDRIRYHFLHESETGAKWERVRLSP